MIFPNKTSAKIIPFPTRGVFICPKKWGKRYVSHGKDYSAREVSAFISALIQNNTEAVKELFKTFGGQLATLHGNYFCLPLLIAANHGNVEIVNLLIVNGACVYTATHDSHFKYINNKMKSYLKSIMRFRQEIWESL